MQRPEYCTDEMLEFLDVLRESGVTNMFGGARYLEDSFPELSDGRARYATSSPKARDVLLYWMHLKNQIAATTVRIKGER